MDVGCRSPDSWLWTDHTQISLSHSPTPPKCSTRAIVALINNLGIVYHQYCSSSYLDYSADHGSLYRSRQWKSSSNLIPTKPPDQQSQSRPPTDLDGSLKGSTASTIALWDHFHTYIIYDFCEFPKSGETSVVVTV